MYSHHYFEISPHNQKDKMFALDLILLNVQHNQYVILFEIFG